MKPRLRTVTLVVTASAAGLLVGVVIAYGAHKIFSPQAAFATPGTGMLV
jgi:hypothetical protein